MTKLLEKHEVKIPRVTTKYKHTHTAFVEAHNKILAAQLFKIQDAQEVNDPEKVLSTCVKQLYGLVDHLNELKTQMTGMSPKDAIGLKKVPPVNRENYLLEDTLPKDGLYCYLLQPGEKHDDQCGRATNRIWSKALYRLRDVASSPGNWVIKMGLKELLYQKS